MSSFTQAYTDMYPQSPGNQNYDFGDVSSTSILLEATITANTNVLDESASNESTCVGNTTTQETQCMPISPKLKSRLRQRKTTCLTTAPAVSKRSKISKRGRPVVFATKRTVLAHISKDPVPSVEYPTYTMKDLLHESEMGAMHVTPIVRQSSIFSCFKIKLPSSWPPSSWIPMR